MAEGIWGDIWGSIWGPIWGISGGLPIVGQYFRASSTRENFSLIDMQVGERKIVRWDLNEILIPSSTTISSVEWEVCSGNSVEIISNTTGTSRIMSLVAAVSQGISIVHATVTYASGEIGVYEVLCKVDQNCT